MQMLRLDEQLVDACQLGDAADAQELLARGASAQHLTAGGCSALVAASQRGHAACVSVLLKAHADPNAFADPTSALLAACLNGHPRCVRLLLQNGAAPDAVASRVPSAITVTPLMATCLEGHVECCQLLLEHLADANQSSGQGVTAMIAACKSSSIGCVQILSAYGASRGPARGANVFDCRTAEEHARGCSPAIFEWLRMTRDWCTLLHHVTILPPTRTRALLRNGADVHCAARLGAPTPIQLAHLQLSQSRGQSSLPSAISAELLLRAAEHWSPSNHELFPHKASDHSWR